MPNKKNKSKKIISIVLSFLLSIFLVIALMFTTIYVSFLTEGSIMRNLRKVNYYDLMQEHIVNNAKDLLLPTGLPETIIDEVFVSAEVANDMEDYISHTFSDGTYVIKEDRIRQKLKENIDQYVATQQLDSDTVSNESIDEIIDELTLVYTTNVKFPFMTQLARMERLVGTGTLIVSIFCLVMTLIIGFIIFRINKWKHRVLRYYAYGIGGASFMMMIGPLILKNGGIYKRLQLTPRFAYNFMVLHIESGLNALILVGGVLLVIYLVLIVLTHYFYKVIN